MHIIGIDFTSRPTRKKPITVQHCVFHEHVLMPLKQERWDSFEPFEQLLQTEGPWIASIDFPFGFGRRFIETAGWPEQWENYVSQLSGMTRDEYRAFLDEYRKHREVGDKEHRRKVDELAGGVSPQKLYGVPVSLMLYEGSPRILKSGATIVPFIQRDPNRIIVEGYPGVLARSIIGRTPYKDGSESDRSARYLARKRILAGLTSEEFHCATGIKVQASTSVCDDPQGDDLDALLCAVQAAWAWDHRNDGYGVPPNVDLLEGWISDPFLSGAQLNQPPHVYDDTDEFDELVDDPELNPANLDEEDHFDDDDGDEYQDPLSLPCDRVATAEDRKRQNAAEAVSTAGKLSVNITLGIISAITALTVLVWPKK